MHQTIRQLIALAGTVILAFLAYYGSYLPFQKGEMFIGATHSLGSVRTLADFKDAISPALDAPSPIGQEELVRNFASTLLGILRSNSGKADLTAAILDLANSYYDPILSRGRGMSFSQDLFIEGSLYETAAVQMRNATYLADAEHYFATGLDIAPRRPQFLYGIFDIYRIEGKYAEARAIGARILNEWPSDDRVKEALAQLPAAGASSTATSTGQ
jgi:hypothetical protein